MVISCSAFGCTNRQGHKKRVSFYRFPEDPAKRSKWVSALRRASWKANSSSRICSDHFISGKKSDNQMSPDYIPSLFCFTSLADRHKRGEELAMFERRQFLIQNIRKGQQHSMAVKAPLPQPDDEGDVTEVEGRKETASGEVEKSPRHLPELQSNASILQQSAIQYPVEDPVLLEHSYMKTISSENEDSHQITNQGGPNEADSSSHTVNAGHQFLMEDAVGLQRVTLKKPAISTEKMQLRPEPAAHDLALIRIKEFKEQIKELEEQYRIEEERALKNRFGLERFAGSDDNIHFYTRFASYKHFMAFWKLIEPATAKMIPPTSRRKVRVKVLAIPGKLPTQTLQRIDEFFLFMAHLALGLEPLDLANLFHIEYLTANKIIRTWANFLYLFLGSVGTWMSKDYAKVHLPEEFNKFPDTQVVISCVEARCQTSSILLADNDMFTYKPFITLKAMVGMTPNGVVNFVSKLFPKSISNRQLFTQSGIIPLLTSDMAIMVDKSFSVSDLVQCKVHHPAFLSKSQQVTVGRVKPSRLRLHVVKMMRRLGAHELFNKVIPLSVAGSIDQLFSVACFLRNYQGIK